MVKNHARKNAAKAAGGKHTEALRRTGVPRQIVDTATWDPYREWNVDEHAVFLISGFAGTGKTTALQSIVTSALADGWDCRVIEPYGFGSFTFADPWLTSYATTVPEIVGVVRELNRELDDRLAARAAGTNDPQPVLLVIDGLWPAGADVLAPLSRLALMGRAAGIRIAIAAQTLNDNRMTHLARRLATTAAHLHLGTLSPSDLETFDDPVRAVDALRGAHEYGVGAYESSTHPVSSVRLPHHTEKDLAAMLHALPVRRRPDYANVSDLRVGDRVRLQHDSNESRWWTVRTGGDRFTILTRQADFQPKGKVFYTIIDAVRGVRGPCDRLFFDVDMETDAGCDELLRGLNAYADWDANPLNGSDVALTAENERRVRFRTQVSHRNNVPIRILEHRR